MTNPTEVIQGSDEWFALRLGKVTASKVSDVMSKGTGRATYMDDLLAERNQKKAELEAKLLEGASPGMGDTDPALFIVG